MSVDVKETVKEMTFNQLSRATKESQSPDDLRSQVHDLFTYHPWDVEQIEAGTRVRDAISAAFVAIVENVPPSSTRTVALRKLTEARMDANAAITFKGRV